MKMLISAGLKLKVSKWAPVIFLNMVGLLLVLNSQKALAVKCEDSSSGSQNFEISLPPMTIPASMPNNTVIWRSPTNTLTVKCYKTYGNVGAENVYAYLNPKKVVFNQGLEFGININGVDHILPSGSNSVKFDLGVTIPPCKTKPNCSNTVKVFPMVYYFYAKKTGNTPSGGNYQGDNRLTYFQLDGYWGLNVHGNYTFSATNMRNIRYVSCNAEAHFSPSTVNLGKVFKSNVVVGQRANGTPANFQLTVTKKCADDFGVSVYYDTTESLSADGTVLQLNNGLNLKLKKDSGSYVEFKKLDENFLIRGLGASSRTEKFTAELYWRTPDPQLGKFSASATVTLYYN